MRAHPPLRQLSAALVVAVYPPPPPLTPSPPLAPPQVDEYNTAYDAQQKRMNALKKEGKVATALPLPLTPHP